MTNENRLESSQPVAQRLHDAEVLWRDAHPGMRDYAPDFCDVMEWLLNEAREAIRLREENRRIGDDLSKSAMQINCAGPVYHRIRILREHFSKELDIADAKICSLQRRLNSLHDGISALVANEFKGGT
jgi:hypothetical protein